MESNKKNRWIEMSIREIWTQCQFAEISFNNINTNNRNDTIFISIHSFLSHCALVSKLLTAQDDSDPGIIISQILNIANSSIIHNRTFRDHLEHYYERLKRWIDKYPININIGTYNIGPKDAFKVSNLLFVNHYDPKTEIFTFLNEDLNLREMYKEVSKIKLIADNWVNSLN